MSEVIFVYVTLDVRFKSGIIVKRKYAWAPKRGYHC